MEANPNHFQKLTPDNNVNLEIYKDAIDFALSNDEIKNIAISGQYGAGKSSVIESYKAQEKKNFLHVSLAHFNEMDKVPPTSFDNPDNKKDNESILEGKILNQLIHQTDPKNIPQSNFKVKKNASHDSLKKTTLKISVFIILLLLIIFNENWYWFVSSLSDSWYKSSLTLFTHEFSLILFTITLVFLSTHFLYKTIQFQQNKSFLRKVTLQGNEIEIFEESEDSYFDKYLNEVLYLFENTNSDAIIFEDIDRLKHSHRIFERLREINFLANINLKKRKEDKKPLKFFYLLRDDIFSSKERTKFFDFIIPIIPVIDSSNSYEKILELFNKNQLIESMEPSFLHGIALYVDDMRILKNIYNEFIIYNKQLNTIELDKNKLLAIITYKNIFPQDFSRLQLNNGFIYKLFINKNKIIENERKLSETRLDSLLSDKESIRNSIIKSKGNVDLLYKAIKENLEEKHRLTEITQDQFELEIEKMEKEIDKLNYDIDILEKYKDKNINDEINKEKLKIKKLTNGKIKDLINSQNSDFIFNENGSDEFYEIKCSNYFSLLKYIIRNGYIDESYPDYITYFYVGNITNTDKIFLRSIFDNNPKEYSYSLSSPKTVFDKLSNLDFLQSESLNFDLLTYLLKNKNDDKAKSSIINLIGQIRNSSNHTFISEYLKNNQCTKEFIEINNLHWPNFFESMCSSEQYNLDTKNKYFIETLSNPNLEKIKDINVNNCLLDYISSNFENLEFEPSKSSKIISSLKKLDIKLSNINQKKHNPSLLEGIYNNSLYLINLENIKCILKNIYQENHSSFGKIKHENYSIILNHTGEPLEIYINKNIVLYIKMICESCNGKIKDNEKAILQVLNNENLLDGLKYEYISNLKSKIDFISDVKDMELWSPLIEKNIPKYNEKNIIEYLKVEEIETDSLVKYINHGKARLNIKRIDNFNETLELRKLLFSNLVDRDDLSDEKYKDIFSSLGLIYNEEAVLPTIEESKFKILIDLHVIKMSLTILNKFRENKNHELTTYLINKNILTYTNLIMEVKTIPHSELIEILSLEMNDDIKINLLSNFNGHISILNKDYSDRIKSLIINEGKFSDDMNDLISEYNNYSEKVKNSIIEFILKKPDEEISNLKFISTDPFKELIKNPELENELKIKLFVIHLSEVKEKSTCNEYFTKLNLSEYSNIFIKNAPLRIPESNINEILLSALKNAKFIKKYQLDTNSGLYKITKNSLYIS